ncbi:DNA-processing protein DprA [Chitinophaga sp. Hz27]|uniref:DNA-processing protein DprA n=1 Tax=Chitinophaga sp. Hz27 TaxID=3347169 RepID=UPI0035DD3C47
MIDMHPSPFKRKVISPYEELLAYEALWNGEKATVKTIAELFLHSSDRMPSELAPKEKIDEAEVYIRQILNTDIGYEFNFLLRGSFEYPDDLLSARYPAQALYYSGDLSLLETRKIAVVGSRKPSSDGVKRAEKITRLLVNDGFTIVSGLAEGIDTVAHTTAIKNAGQTIGVIGTPIETFYPKSNVELQKFIAQHHLLVSQVPIMHYHNMHYLGQKIFFPERNKTMSALSEATVIVEASDTSGTLIQAKAAMEQGRKLFILDSCFLNPGISWPSKYEGRENVFRVKEYSDLINNL